MKKLSKLISLMLSVVLCIGMATPALAVEYNIADGDVHIENDDKGVFSYQIKADDLRSDNTYKTDEDPDIIITGTTKKNTITVGEGVNDTTITLKGVSIDAGGTGCNNIKYPYQVGAAALSITGEQSDVTVKVEGTNILRGGVARAGLELSGGASVTVQSDDTGSLTVWGGDYGAGIGSGRDGKAGDITISTNGSGSVAAVGGWGGAGIGSGWYNSTVGAITISTNDSSSVAAYGGNIGGAGIGSGYSFGSENSAGNIKISTNGSAKVTAMGNYGAAGIGSGWKSTAQNITISGSGSVTATGGADGGAGIGSGYNGTSDAITISCAKVEATGQGGGANIGAGKDGTSGTFEQNPHNYQLVTTPASCTEAGSKKYTCKNCDDSYTEEGDPATGHNYTSEITREATCTEDGEMTYTCVKGDDSYTETIPAKGHGEGVWTVTTPAQPGVPGVETLVCPDCGEPLGQTRPIPALPVPAIPDDGGADAAPDAATIADQEVPLAGLTPLYMLLEELRKYEKVEDIELPEDFKWLDHEYAQAIYWGLQEELVVDTEEEPLHPDEVITVALLRSVLTNFVEYKGAELVVTLTGEDDEIVFDLGERLTVFYTELEAALTAKAA